VAGAPLGPDQAPRGTAPAPREGATCWVATARCNLGCTFCVPRAATPPPYRLADAAEFAQPVVVTGGEPLLAPGLLQRLHRLGRPVLLETNGTLLYAAASVRRLAAAGVTEFRMFLPGWDRASTDELARCEGAGALQEAAAAHIGSVERTLSFSVPVSEPLVEHLPSYLDRVDTLRRVARRGGARCPEVNLRYLGGPAPSRALERALGRLALAAIRRGMVVHFGERDAPAPCLFHRPEAFASLFEARRGVPSGACQTCCLAAWCAGPPAEGAAHAISPESRHPVAFEAALETLRGAGEVQDWIRAGDSTRFGREKFVSLGSECDLATGRSVLAALIRPAYRCNQRCTFCWVDTNQRSPPDSAVTQTLAYAAVEGLGALTLTGGEPTVDPRLPRFLELARALGVGQVTLQTNAVLLDDDVLVRTLVDAGLKRVFVALHGAEAAISDSITGAPGTFARSLRGIRNLREAGVSVGIGIVFTRANAAQARQFVRFVAGTMPGVDLTLSVAAPVNELVPVRDAVPRYLDLAPALRCAMQTAHELGVPCLGLFGQCGIPPCVLDADPDCFPELSRELDVWSSPVDFEHVAACAGCRLERKCPGVRKLYLAAYGADEFHPVR
jgi:MoaA/NifB/PqqE/SkfB family radical SAM enzyme